jgi:hypothetical protein
MTKINLHQNYDYFIDLYDSFFRLPDQSVLPSLANGHIGFVIRTPDLTMNGLYNGYIGHSHRARIQNHGNIQIKVFNIHC